jgi:2-aminobenzoate-CoA ligase
MRANQIDRFVHDRLPTTAQCSRILRDPALPPPRNLATALLDDAVNEKGWGERVMLRSDTEAITYARALHSVNQIATLLVQDLKLIPGNRVLLRGVNSIAFALAWLAVVKTGCIAVATMPLLRAKELSEILRKAQPAAALCDAALLDELDLACAQFPQTVQRIILHANDPAEGVRARAAHTSQRFDSFTIAEDDLALLAFTSGTTGTPKAAAHSHRDILAACEAWPRHVLRLQANDMVVGTPPLAFTFGLGGLLVFPLWAGASVYFPSVPYTPETMVSTIARIGATVSVTAPTFYRQMASFVPPQKLPTLRRSVSAGEALPDSTRQIWKHATGIEMTDGIGATELFHIFISSADREVRPGAIGKVVPGYVARVVDEHGIECPRGTIGRLAVIGPTGCRYVDDARQTQYVKDGWNYPGDAFWQDADGYFWYHARADDMIVTSGYNVSGPEVEQALLGHVAVAECAVIGVPDEVRGMLVKAFVVTKPGYAADAALIQSLQEHVKATLAPYKYPRAIEVIDALPRTETGKLQRYKLKSIT